MARRYARMVSWGPRSASCWTTCSPLRHGHGDGRVSVDVSADAADGDLVGRARVLALLHDLLADYPQDLHLAGRAGGCKERLG